MMAKYKRKNPESVADRLRWLAPHVEGFAAQLGQSGYSAATITELTRLLACWAEWMRNAGFEIDSIETGLATSAGVFRGSKTARARGAAALFVAYLRRHGVLPPIVPQARPEEVWPVLAAFRSWMREQRGVADSTLNKYQLILADLLALLGDDPTAYTAAAIRRFVLRGRLQPIMVEQHVLEYEQYLQDVRALSRLTIINYRPIVRDFLNFRFSDGDVSLTQLRAVDVTTFVQMRISHLNMRRAKTMTTALRSFL
jgi:hypothetical protein